ncbi:MAG TPA: hypothetical protein VJV05_05070 [Pyrinomonadaceae bacterium]|nr:hypothetical protein [Pyrinomonadaceae bacterium]
MAQIVLVVLALGISFGAVALYYVLTALISVVAQTVLYYDRPQGWLYKIVEFPMNLPGVAFDRLVPRGIRFKYFNMKEGYLKKEMICFLLNVFLYALPVYFLLTW